MKRKLIYTFPLMLTMSSVTLAQTAAGTAGQKDLSQVMTDPMNYIMVFAIAVLLATILVMARVIKLLTWQISGPPVSVESKIEVETAKVKKPTMWTKINKLLSDAVPVEKEADVLLDHDYDGIKELDNNLPPWWKYGFYLTIVFALLYMVHYHVVGSGNVQLDEYNGQLAKAELQKQERLKNVAANVDENTVTILTEASDVASGKKIYVEKCMVCHGASGEGNVGPNLTDEYWIHGGSINDIFKIVKYGFPSKGMLSWQGQLSPVQIQQVSSFINTLKGTNPPNPKEPQGEKYIEQTTPTENVQTGQSVPDSTATAGI